MEKEQVRMLYNSFLNNKMKIKIMNGECFVKSNWMMDWFPIAIGWEFMERYTINRD